MKKILLLICIFILPQAAIAKPVYLVEIASFYCGHCKKMDVYHDTIKNAVSRTGGRFVFAPFPTEADNLWVERLYYTIRNNSSLEEKVRKALYRGATTLRVPFRSLESLIDWLSINVRQENVDWELVAEKTLNENSMKPIKKAARIVSELGLSEVPAYVIVNDDKFILVHAMGEPSERVSSVLKAIKQQADAG